MSTGATNRFSSGIPGVDEILLGGFIPNRDYLVRGGPGMGKTTFGLHFLTAGAAAGEPVLFITLEAPEHQVRRDARSQGFDLDGVSFVDLSPTAEVFTEARSYDIFTPAEVERGPTTERIVESVESVRPQRIFVDAISTFRFLIRDTFQFRKQVLSFLRFLSERGATVLLSSEATERIPDDDLQFICDGVVDLGFATDKHSLRRTLTVTKYRGSDFRSGRHTMRLTDRGMEVYPNLAPLPDRPPASGEMIPSGIDRIDEMLHGGIESGSVTIISGPGGVGKTTLGMQFMKSVAARGERAVIFTFDERPETLLLRTESVQGSLRPVLERGTLSIIPVDPIRTTAGEFAQMMRGMVEHGAVRAIMVDSISGYRLMTKTEDVGTGLYALCRYLRDAGVTLFLTNEVENIVGESRVTDVAIGYLADNILLMRYVEMHGQLRKAIGVLKKRVTDFDKTIREFEITGHGIEIGSPVAGTGGVLRGTLDPMPQRTSRE